MKSCYNPIKYPIFCFSWIGFYVSLYLILIFILKSDMVSPKFQLESCQESIFDLREVASLAPHKAK